MKAPLSNEIVKVLQDDRAASKLVDTVLKERASRGNHQISVRIGDCSRIYKPVTAIQRKK